MFRFSLALGCSLGLHRAAFAADREARPLDMLTGHIEVHLLPFAAAKVHLQEVR